MRVAAIILAATTGISGCSINIAYRNERTSKTYGLTVIKEITMSEKYCAVVVDPPSLGHGRVDDVDLEDCKKLNVGDTVIVTEITINGRHSARIRR